MVAKESKKSVSAISRQELKEENKELHRKIKELKKLQEEKERRLEIEYKQKYFAFFDNIAHALFIYDSITYQFLHCNEAAVSNYGFSQEEFLNMTPFDLHNVEEFEQVRKNIDKKSTDNPNVYTHYTKDRVPRIVEISTTDIYFEGNAAWMSIIHDITERITMEKELNQYKYKLEEMINERTIEVLIANKKLKQEIIDRKKAELGILESEKKFRSVIEKFLDGVILLDSNGSIIEWNQVQESIYGVKRSFVIGKKIWDVQYKQLPNESQLGEKYKEIKKIWFEFLKTGIDPIRENPRVSIIQDANGKLIRVQQLYFSIHTDRGVMIAITTRDITKQLILEEQLSQAGKMEAMGTLAGGIAHDFNNILAGIMGYTDLAIRKTDAKAPTQRYLSQVLTATKRATDLVKQILTFSRKDRQEKEPLLLCSIVKEALKLLRSSLPTTIEIIIKNHAENCFVMADPTQLHQVVMNLCTNAGHAMNETGGVMEVRLTEETIEDGTYKGLAPGRHVRLTVSDTGCGIKPEVLEKIFDPFFTTKKSGEGTGMGLAVVHQIIANHNGNISVYSKEDEGTIFSILLPLIVNVIIPENNELDEIPGGNERILLVDDDTLLIDAERILFEELGYHVTAKTSSIEALEIFKKVPDRFDFIITDYTMPRMTGAQLTVEIRKIRPEIPIILCTGYSQVLSPKKASDIGIDELVLKPIDLGHMARSIRRLLEKKK
jgi:PAS domain S-box-containing protein